MSKLFDRTSTVVPRRDIDRETIKNNEIVTYTMSAEELSKYDNIPSPRDSLGKKIRKPHIQIPSGKGRRGNSKRTKGE